MALLLDTLMADGWSQAPWYSKPMPRLRTLFDPALTAVSVTDLYETFLAHAGTWVYPNLLLPFETLWFEGRILNADLKKGFDSIEAAQIKAGTLKAPIGDGRSPYRADGSSRWGVHVTMIPKYGQALVGRRIVGYVLRFLPFLEYIGPHHGGYQRNPIGPLCFWDLHVTTEGEVNRSEAHARNRMRMGLEENWQESVEVQGVTLKRMTAAQMREGAPITTDELPLELILPNEYVDPNDDEGRINLARLQAGAAISTVFLEQVVFAISMMNCKNIVKVAIDPDPKLQKVRAKKKKKPLVRYHVLRIVPNKVKYRRPVLHKTDRHPAVHICRGHFRTYTKEAPLMGKAVGTFWFQSHVRGSRSEGMVLKDYEVVT